MSTGSGKLLGVQYLRALAAVMVAYYHLEGQFPQYTAYLAFRGSARLPAGVDIFFVISGFIMLVTSRESRPLEFLRRRAVRIVPLYWILTATLAALAVTVPSLFRTSVVRPEYLIKSLLFIPYANPGQEGHLWPLLVPGWSLNYEMFFYGLFAIALLAYLSRLFYLPAKYSVALLALSAGYLFGSQPIMGIEVPAVLIALCVVSLDAVGGTARLKLPTMLGDAAYSLYLTHIFTLGIMRTIWAHLVSNHDGATSAYLFAAISMAAVAIVALVIHRNVERPMQRYLEKWLQGVAAALERRAAPQNVSRCHIRHNREPECTVVGSAGLPGNGRIAVRVSDFLTLISRP